VLSSTTPLSAARERGIKKSDEFKECKDCPAMVVVPEGSFMMGSPDGKGESNEHPQHKVTIANPFAVSKFVVTFNEWKVCASHGYCDAGVYEDRSQHGSSAIYATWDDAHMYVAWLSKITGKPYRLLSEAEYEYAARAGTETEYPWGNNDNASERDNLAPNRFGLYYMALKVASWTEDCWNDSYEGAPAEGSAWTSGVCRSGLALVGHRMVRGGPEGFRSAYRTQLETRTRSQDLGFRIARTVSVAAEGTAVAPETR
jgi:formylglycine-generating enzyme required for sulfatase activity